MDTSPIKTPFIFGTKAETLERLLEHLTTGHLCDQIIVDQAMWGKSKRDQLENIINTFQGQLLIVRSSARSEDTHGNSMAGAYLSLANIQPATHALSSAIDDVFASYSEPNDTDQVLVQPMVQHVSISGVLLTRDLDTGSPYYAINYDASSGRTDTVTGGHESTAMLVRRDATGTVKSSRILKLLNCVKELEHITGSHELDIEFCITEEGDVFILQVRPLAARGNWSSLADEDVNEATFKIRKSLSAFMQSSQSIHGKTTIFAEMTDWNPAEMIGNTPRPLALSLYKSLITNSVWAKAREAMGYNMVKGELLVDFYGRPFIDVRKSFNSFLPAHVPAKISEKLVTSQIEKLANNRDLHDKVEFEICVTCWDFSEDEARQRFLDAGLTVEEALLLETALTSLTRVILNEGADKLNSLLDDTNLLLFDNDDQAKIDPLGRIETLLDQCRNFGTLNFSQLARHGFIGVQFLKSLVAKGALSTQEMDAFMHSISTVATHLTNDFYAVTTNNMPQDQFLKKYGHLRPGTYDILSWRYDERPDLYLRHDGKHSAMIMHEPFILSQQARQKTKELLDNAQYGITVDAFYEYIATAIKGREQAKFAFTRTISEALSILANWGEGVGLSRDDISYLPINMLVADADVTTLKEHLTIAREQYILTRAIRLPHILLSPDDVDVVRMPLGQPTFITSHAVTAKTQILTSIEAPDIDNCIVLIESADPGFDWIFSHSILGLITKYGGANSHMAIRCAEFGLPAAIGCGERLFDILSKANVVELNAAAKRISAH